jgi:hypothetical protein
MRRFLLIFMLFLLPLRGLVGDAMAYSMLPHAPQTAGNVPSDTINLVAARATFYWASSQFEQEKPVETATQHPCHTDMAAADDADAVQNQCSTCQACHLVVASPVHTPSALLHTTAAAPLERPVLWRSADARLPAKTPLL